MENKKDKATKKCYFCKFDEENHYGGSCLKVIDSETDKYYKDEDDQTVPYIAKRPNKDFYCLETNSSDGMMRARINFCPICGRKL